MDTVWVFLFCSSGAGTQRPLSHTPSSRPFYKWNREAVSLWRLVVCEPAEGKRGEAEEKCGHQHLSN